MRQPYKKLSDLVKEKLIAKGFYDKTPDTNIEALNKSIIDNMTDNMANLNTNTLKKSPLVKEIEKQKNKKKEKPIKTSLLLCTTRY